eukprot:gene6136-6756_t
MSKPHHHKAEKDDAIYHMAASGIAAVLNFPLWRASAIAQSGFKLEGSNVLVRYYKAVVHPPFKGVLATLAGMTWARAAIFYGSDMGKGWMKEKGFNAAAAQTVPPFLMGTFVQVVNQPLVRSTITIQDPSSTHRNVMSALIHIYKNRGVSGLWHGVSAGILKTVPKYITAVAVKDYMEDVLPLVDPHDKNAILLRSAMKSVSAGIAGAALTNPLDVIRNEMFKTDHGLVDTTKRLMKEEGWAFMARGMASNVTAVAIPIAMTIFATDVMLSMKDLAREEPKH